jgi:HEAT repeat protein
LGHFLIYLLAGPATGSIMLTIRQLRSHIHALDKGDEAACQEALHALVQHGAKDWATAPLPVVDSLVGSLQDQLRNGLKRPSRRQEVATILGNIGLRSEPAVPLLIELLQTRIPDSTCEAAATALGKIGKKAKSAVDQLVLLLSSGHAVRVVQVVRALGEIGCANQSVRVALTSLWLSPPQSQASQLHVAIALCKLSFDVNGLLRLLTTTLVANQDAALRKLAAEALGWCSKDELDVVPALLNGILQDKNDEVQQAAQAALNQLGLSRAKAIQLCSSQLRESQFAEAALKHGGQAAVPALVGALQAEEPKTREKAARILGQIGTAALEAAPALTALLQAKNPDVRLAAAKGLWLITLNANVVVPVLVDLLNNKWAVKFEGGDSHRRHVQAVIESLGRIGLAANAAVPALTTKTKDKSRLISESAVYALREIAPIVPTKGGLNSCSPR